MSQVNLDQIHERYKNVTEIEEIVGVWRFIIEDCPISLQVKVVKLGQPQDLYMGIANYAIQNPKQATPYKSLRQLPTIQDALEDALNGFLMFWDPKYASQTKFVLDKDW